MYDGSGGGIMMMENSLLTKLSEVFGVDPKTTLSIKIETFKGGFNSVTIEKYIIDKERDRITLIAEEYSLGALIASKKLGKVSE